MDEILRDLSAGALIAAIEENMFDFFRYSTLAEVHDEPELLWWITDQPEPIFNMLFRPKLTEESAGAAIEAAIARAQAKEVTLFWWTGPATRPPSLEAQLEAHGVLLEKTPGMALDLRELQEAKPVPGLVIERVDNSEALRHWCEISAAGFGMSSEGAAAWFDIYTSLNFVTHQPLRHYVGYFDGVPVATSTLYLSSGVAGIYSVATLPEYRRRGIAAATTSLPLVEAKQLGYRAAVLSASAMGVKIYESLGFRQYCDIGLSFWMEKTEAQA
jgi:ribosomal protein S18 acetylase RimI-like enzyme